MVECAHCGVTITKKHLVVHMRKLHPEVVYPAAPKLLTRIQEGGSGPDSSRTHQHTQQQVSSTSSHEYFDGYPVGVNSKGGHDGTKGGHNAMAPPSEKMPTVVCTHCDKEFTKKNIGAHTRLVHPLLAAGAGAQEEGRPALAVSVSCPTTQCVYCRKTITKKSIRAHVRNLHPNAAALAAGVGGAGHKEKGPCSDSTNKKTSAAATTMLSTTPAAASTTAPALKVISIHGRMQTVACQYCQLQVPQTEVSSHVKVAHARTRTALCKYCPKLIQYRNMNTHVRKYHVVESVVEGLVGQVCYNVGGISPDQLSSLLVPSASSFLL